MDHVHRDSRGPHRAQRRGGTWPSVGGECHVQDALRVQRRRGHLGGVFHASGDIRHLFRVGVFLRVVPGTVQAVHGEGRRAALDEEFLQVADGHTHAGGVPRGGTAAGRVGGEGGVGGGGSRESGESGESEGLGEETRKEHERRRGLFVVVACISLYQHRRRSSASVVFGIDRKSLRIASLTAAGNRLGRFPSHPPRPPRRAPPRRRARPQPSPS